MFFIFPKQLFLCPFVTLITSPLLLCSLLHVHGTVLKETTCFIQYVTIRPTNELRLRQHNWLVRNITGYICTLFGLV
jgi:hypothetical protein